MLINDVVSRLIMSSVDNINVSKPTQVTRSEDVLGEKWDRCLVDAGIKLAGGFTVGALFSLLFFKRRSWPLIFGTGSGFGMAYQNCQNEFNKK